VHASGGNCQLVNDGSAAAPKWGLRSIVWDDWITLGPLLPSVRCAVVYATLMFTISWQERFGSISFNTSGCRSVTSPSKKPLVSPKAASTLLPSASYACGRAELRTPSMEATITGYTKWLLHKDASSCFLTIRHSRGRYQNRSWRERSYAKVEGLAFSVLDCESSCWLAHYVRGFGAAAANCSAGARAGGIGHAGAHCLASNHRHGCSYAPSDPHGIASTVDSTTSFGAQPRGVKE